MAVSLSGVWFFAHFVDRVLKPSVTRLMAEY